MKTSVHEEQIVTIKDQDPTYDIIRKIIAENKTERC